MLLEICLLLFGILALLFDQFYTQEGYRATWGPQPAQGLPQIYFKFPSRYYYKPDELSEVPETWVQVPEYPNWPLARQHIRQILGQLPQTKYMHISALSEQDLSYRLWLWLLGGIQFKEDIREAYLRGGWANTPQVKVYLWHVQSSWKGEVILLNDSKKSVCISLADISENLQYAEQIFPDLGQEEAESLFQEPLWEKKQVKGEYLLRAGAIARVSIFPFSSWEELRSNPAHPPMGVTFLGEYWHITIQTKQHDFIGTLQLYNTEDQCIWEDILRVYIAGHYRLELEAKHIPPGAYRFSFQEPGLYHSVWINYP